MHSYYLYSHASPPLSLSLVECSPTVKDVQCYPALCRVSRLKKLRMLPFRTLIGEEKRDTKSADSESLPHDGKGRYRFV